MIRVVFFIMGVVLGFFIFKKTENKLLKYPDRQIRILMDYETVYYLNTITRSLELLHAGDYAALDSYLNTIARISIRTIEFRLKAENNGTFGDMVGEPLDALVVEIFAKDTIEKFMNAQGHRDGNVIEMDDRMIGEGDGAAGGR